MSLTAKTINTESNVEEVRPKIKYFIKKKKLFSDKSSKYT